MGTTSTTSCLNRTSPRFEMWSTSVSSPSLSTVGSDTTYDLGPLDDDADDAASRRWMADSQRTNNSLVKRILKAITGGCLGTPSTAEPRREQPTPSCHRPGKETAGTARGEEETPWATPRKRNRRSAGQSEGDDTD
ncbi:hypothetical protein F2Q68_00014238 [Brassica cretica]|uniref:Uncharacterized protein n=1 Tax=Brassica cretica TaxID=69181 RepID=A0A8S9HIF9_BRACR|nr:hypothetical protein F2Q68_00014238 [Brassica cretica]